MIYILTTSIDITASEVSYWLKVYKHEICRINTDIQIKPNLLFCEQDFVTKKNTVWLRKIWNLNIQNPKISTISNHIHNELYHGLYFTLNHTCYKVLGNIESSLIFNKPSFLIKAASVGLKTPDFILTNNKMDIASFLSKHPSIVTKCVSDVQPFEIDNKRHKQYVQKITKKDLEKLPNNFEISFFQQAITNKYDIKTFYLDGEMFSCAFVNTAEKVIDYRSLGYSQQIKITPITLPKSIESKIKKLMKLYGLNIATIDFIVDDENDFFIVDLNPAGQFGDISKMCNYYLEKKIAQWLNNNEKRSKQN